MSGVTAKHAKGAGIVNYRWPKPGAEAPVAKTSYIQLFEPWGWIIGSGVYVDDVQAEYERLNGLGVRFTQQPMNMGPVTTAVFDDTCGNLIQIAHMAG